MVTANLKSEAETRVFNHLAGVNLPLGDATAEGAFAADPPLAETPELMQELADASAKLETASPMDIIKYAVDRFSPRFSMATAFGPEGMSIIAMLADIAPQTPIFNLETGYQFKETLDLVDTIAERYGIAVELRKPRLTVIDYEQLHGGPLYNRNPTQCCGDRKLAVLRDAAKGLHAWASAIRRDQSPDRAAAPIVGWDKKFKLVKISPLANWGKKDVWSYISKNNVPYNPLHDKGYRSIGCWPCTRATSLDEDERAGRWSGTQKTECGLHSAE